MSRHREAERPEAFAFGTKAETLMRLVPRVRSAAIPDLCFFTVEQWHAGREALLDRIQAHFGDALLAIRSSALTEDGARTSNAGAFLSRLRVSGANRAELAVAVDSVAASMTGHPRDQVLVQAMAEQIVLSGVLMTFDLVHGAPYYCIEYEDETGRTDLVTSGTGVHKGLSIYREADPALIRSPRVASFLGLARELEALCACVALDIEFGMRADGQLVLFQVRRIALAHSWHPVTEIRVRRQMVYVEQFIRDCSRRLDGILGERTVLAAMPDWNPAEIIGTMPRPLAASLYRELITDATWHRARAAMGYRRLPDVGLMVLICGHPYVDVRKSFNSFLPAGVPDEIGERLVNAWLERLESAPELHDKVEFEIVPTCMDFCFDLDFPARYPGLLADGELARYRRELVRLTRRALAGGGEGALARALTEAGRLGGLSLPDPVEQGGNAWLGRAAYLLGLCREAGALSFAVVARHAFIAESLLRSACRRGVLTAERISAFRRSIQTVTGEMVAAYGQACHDASARQAFLREFGHLRPGTYEITSLRYDERDDLFDADAEQGVSAAHAVFALTPAERAGLLALLAEAELDVVDAEGLLAYVRDAIVGREHVKFLFTRVLSNALSAVVCWGERHGLSRDDLSYVPWPRLVERLLEPTMDYMDRSLLQLADEGRANLSAAQSFRFSHTLFGVDDLHIALQSRSVPNFVGSGRASGGVVELTASTSANIHIRNRIVCIESADPGFDWIFTKGPAALITRFGGANSHMAIRCAELGLPAAIGCGAQFVRILAAGQVELDCSQRVLKILGGS